MGRSSWSKTFSGVSAIEGRTKNRSVLSARLPQEVARPTFFGVLIIVLVYVPILTLRGVEGKMFRPMAMTVLFALAASLVIAIVVMPVLSSYVFRKPVTENETWLMRMAGNAYVPVLAESSAFPAADRRSRSACFRRFFGHRSLPRRGIHSNTRRGLDCRHDVSGSWHLGQPNRCTGTKSSRTFCANSRKSRRCIAARVGLKSPPTRWPSTKATSMCS